mgnify:CR=1 FL=1
MSVRTILALRALGLGDLLTGIPALRALQRAYPHHRIVLATPRSLQPIVPLVGGISEVLHTRRTGDLHWRRAAPEIAVNLHGPGPQSIADLHRTGAGRIITHRHPEFPDIAGPEWNDDIHVIDRWCQLLERSGIETDRTNFGLTHPGVARSGVIVHPGAGSPARRWPAERFADIARHLRKQGKQVRITGSFAERRLATQIAQRAGLDDRAVLAGKHNVGELATSVAGAELVVCGDTGIGHLATALGTPSVVLFGPTPPRLWGPPPDMRRHIALWSGAVGDPHAHRPDPGLLALTVPDVISAVDRQLERYPAGREFSGVS